MTQYKVTLTISVNKDWVKSHISAYIKTQLKHLGVIIESIEEIIAKDWPKRGE